MDWYRASKMSYTSNHSQLLHRSATSFMTLTRELYAVGTVCSVRQTNSRAPQGDKWASSNSFVLWRTTSVTPCLMTSRVLRPCRSEKCSMQLFSLSRMIKDIIMHENRQSGKEHLRLDAEH